MELVAEYCKKVYLLYNGEILVEGPTDSVFLEPDTLRKSYITPPQVTRLAMLINRNVSDFPPGLLTLDQMKKELNPYFLKSY